MVASKLTFMFNDNVGSFSESFYSPQDASFWTEAKALPYITKRLAASGNNTEFWFLRVEQVSQDRAVRMLFANNWHGVGKPGTFVGPPPFLPHHRQSAAPWTSLLCRKERIGIGGTTMYFRGQPNIELIKGGIYHGDALYRTAWFHWVNTLTSPPFNFCYKTIGENINAPARIVSAESNPTTGNVTFILDRNLFDGLQIPSFAFVRIKGVEQPKSMNGPLVVEVKYPNIALTVTPISSQNFVGPQGVMSFKGVSYAPIKNIVIERVVRRTAGRPFRLLSWTVDDPEAPVNFDPCGMVVDAGRSCRHSWFRMFTDQVTIPGTRLPEVPGYKNAVAWFAGGAPLVRIRWYVAPAGALALPGPPVLFPGDQGGTIFHSDQWSDDDEKTGIVWGEQPYNDQQYFDGETPVGVTGQSWCGNLLNFRLPQIYTGPGMAIARRADGIPYCCLRKAGFGGGVVWIARQPSTRAGIVWQAKEPVTGAKGDVVWVAGSVIPSWRSRIHYIKPATPSHLSDIVWVSPSRPSPATGSRIVWTSGEEIEPPTAGIVWSSGAELPAAGGGVVWITEASTPAVGEVAFIAITSTPAVGYIAWSGAAQVPAIAGGVVWSAGNLLSPIASGIVWSGGAELPAAGGDVAWFGLASTPAIGEVAWIAIASTPAIGYVVWSGPTEVPAITSGVVWTGGPALQSANAGIAWVGARPFPSIGFVVWQGGAVTPAIGSALVWTGGAPQPAYGGGVVWNALPAQPSVPPGGVGWLSGPPSPNSQLFTASGTFVAPPGVYFVVVEMIGGGGASDVGLPFATGGGGGGAYARVNAYPVVPGNSYPVKVGDGTGAQASYFDGGLLALAAGGGDAAVTAGGLGGQVSGCIGDVAFAGGDGAGSAGSSGGGGGGSAFYNAIGGNASLSAGGVGTGNGGDGGAVGVDGQVGAQPGGGGGGGGDSGGNGALGGAGWVRITW